MNHYFSAVALIFVSHMVKFGCVWAPGAVEGGGLFVVFYGTCTFFHYYTFTVILLKYCKMLSYSPVTPMDMID